MMITDTKSGTIVLLLVLLFSSAVLPYKKIKVFVLQPPELVLEGVKQLAVMDFEGEFGSAFTDALVNQMLKSDRGITDVRQGFFSGSREGVSLQEGAYTNIFDIIERGRLAQILSEQSLANSGLIDPNQAVQIGQIAGVQAIVVGEISYTHKTEDGKVEQRTKQGTRYVPARFRRVETTIKYKVIDVQTGRILGSDERRAAVEDRKYDQEINNIFDVRSGVESCIVTLSYSAANYLTPHFELGEFEFQKVKEKNVKDKADEAAKLAEDLEVDKAYLVFNSLREIDSYNHKLLYNMGILNEVVGNAHEAKEFYGMALQLNPKEGDYQKALDRIEKSVIFQDVLARIGVEIQTHSFDFSEAQQAAALAETIELKGKDSERVPVYKSPAMSEVVARVPGGTSFVVLASDKGCYKIKLLGNAEGYVSAADVK